MYDIFCVSKFNEWQAIILINFTLLKVSKLSWFFIIPNLTNKQNYQNLIWTIKSFTYIRIIFPFAKWLLWFHDHLHEYKLRMYMYFIPNFLHGINSKHPHILYLQKVNHTTETYLKFNTGVGKICTNHANIPWTLGTITILSEKKYSVTAAFW